MLDKCRTSVSGEIVQVPLWETKRAEQQILMLRVMEHRNINMGLVVLTVVANNQPVIIKCAEVVHYNELILKSTPGNTIMRDDQGKYYYAGSIPI